MGRPIAMMNRYDWHPWFAWYRVPLWTEINEGQGKYWTTNGDHAWLSTIECRIRGAVAPNGDLTEYWQYRRRRT